MTRPLTYLEAVLAERWAFEYFQGRRGALEDLQDYVPDAKSSGLSDEWFLALATRLMSLPERSLVEREIISNVGRLLGWRFAYALVVTSADLRPSLCGHFEMQARIALFELEESRLEEYLRLYAEIGGRVMTLADLKGILESADTPAPPDGYEARVLTMQNMVLEGAFEEAAAADLDFRKTYGHAAPANLRRQIFALGLEQPDFNLILDYARRKTLRSRDLSELLKKARDQALDSVQLETLLDCIQVTDPDPLLTWDIVSFLSARALHVELTTYLLRLPEYLIDSEVFIKAGYALAKAEPAVLRGMLQEVPAETLSLKCQCLLLAGILGRDLELIGETLGRLAPDSTEASPMLKVLLHIAMTLSDHPGVAGQRVKAIEGMGSLDERDVTLVTTLMPPGDPDLIREVQSRGTAQSLQEKAMFAHYFAASGAREEAVALFEEVWPNRARLPSLPYRYLVTALTHLGDAKLGMTSLRDVVNDSHLDGEQLARVFGGILKIARGAGLTAEAESLLTEASDLLDAAPVASRAILFNLVVAGYAAEQRLDDAVRVKELMISLGLPIDRYTLGSLSNVMYGGGGLQTQKGQIRAGNADEWQALAVLFDDVVHELNQPVGRAGMAVRLLQNARKADSRDLEDKAVEALESAVRELGDRLGVYKGLTGSPGSSERVAVDALVEQVVELTRKLAEATDIEIEHVSSKSDSASLDVLGDAFQLRLAVRALIVNAIQALSDRPTENRRILISVMRTDNSRDEQSYVDMYVRDNGPGIPADAREKIFSRGYTTKPGRGLGLGLSLVHSVVGNHGGSIALQEEVDSGAEFWIRLPAY